MVNFGRILPLITLLFIVLAACAAEQSVPLSVSQLPTAAISATELPPAEAPPSTNTPTTVAPSETATPLATATPVATETNIAPSATTEPTALPTEATASTPIAEPSATATLAPSNTPEPTPIPMPTNTPEPTPEPTAQPSPTPDNALWLMGFDSPADTGQWYIVNDTVMGGVSTADGFVADSVLTFNGDLSLDNNGGFTSIRREFTPDLTAYTGLQLRVRGDGRTYFMRVSDNTDGYEVSHEVPFATVSGEWTLLTLPFENFIPNFRGRNLDRPPLDRSALRTMSIMLREKNPGFFQLEIDWMQAYK